MKHLTLIITLSLFTLHLSLPAAVPVRWTVETSRVQPAVFEAYQGETLDLAASLQSNGRQVEIPGEARLYWQTNGMGARWWTAPASVSSNVLSAVWSPTNDVGARVYTCFIGQTGSNYRAEFQLRLRPSPGATPNLLPLPTVTYDARLNGTPTINGTNLIDYVVAASGAEVDPTVPAWAKQPNPPQSGTDENAVRAIVGSFAETGTVYRAASVGDAETWTDKNGHVFRVDMRWVPVGAGEYEDVLSTVTYRYLDGQDPDDNYGHADFWVPVGLPEGWFYYPILNPYYEATPLDTHLANIYLYVDGNTIGPYDAYYLPITNLVGRVALTNDVPSSPGDIGAAPASIVQRIDDVEGTVSAWTTYWDGDDVRVTVTNYYGSIDIPHLYIEQQMPADDTHDAAWFKTIWDEMTRWNSFLSSYADMTNHVENDLADRAWGVYDSHTGEYSPDGYTQISSSNILIAAGMAYQKTVTTDGEVWILTSTEPTTISGVSSNGFFRISDGDGNALFEIVKGDKRTVGAYGSGIRATSTGVEIPYNVVSETPPTMYATSSLSIPFAAESSSILIVPGSSSMAEVSWTGSSGAWVCHITWGGERPKAAFFKAKYQTGGETYIKNSAPISAGGGILCTDGIHKCRPVYNNGSITWEVVQ